MFKKKKKKKRKRKRKERGYTNLATQDTLALWYSVLVASYRFDFDEFGQSHPDPGRQYFNVTMWPSGKAMRIDFLRGSHKIRDETVPDFDRNRKLRKKSLCHPGNVRGS